MRLSLYIGRRFLAMLALVLVLFFAVLFFIDLIEEVRRVSTGGFGAAARLALLNTPGTLYGILPLIFVLAAIALFLRLARTSELVAIRAAGRSALRTLVAPMLAAFLFGIMAVALLNPIAAATNKRYDQLAARADQGAGATEASFGGDGIWLRQGDGSGQWMIHADRASVDGSALYNVTFLAFGPTGGPRLRIEAQQADANGGRWIAKDAKEWHFDVANPEEGATLAAELPLTADLTAAQIRDSSGAPQNVSIWDLPAYIADLERAGLSARAHSVWLQMELALPLLLPAMVLIGAGFTMRHARFGNSGILVLAALVSGIAVFFVRNFAQVLGENGQIPVLLAAWSPPIAALLLSVSLLLHLEDG